MYPQSLEDLTDYLSALPGIGRRTAERLALALLDWDVRQLKDLGELLIVLKSRVRCCRDCGNLTESDLCSICLDTKRNHSLICVVENVRQIPVIERCGHFDGVYHVLGGRLSPLDDIDIHDLQVESLYRRIENRRSLEVILSTSPDVEGQATAAYLAEELNQKFDITVSRIAFGVPVGADLTFADAATMAMAIDSRRPM